MNSTHPRVPERVGGAPGAAVSGGEGHTYNLSIYLSIYLSIHICIYSYI